MEVYYREPHSTKWKMEVKPKSKARQFIEWVVNSLWYGYEMEWHEYDHGMYYMVQPEIGEEIPYTGLNAVNTWVYGRSKR